MRIYKIWFNDADDIVLKYRAIEGYNNMNNNERESVESFGYTLEGFNTKYKVYSSYVDIDFDIEKGITHSIGYKMFKLKQNLFSIILNEKLEKLI